MLKLGSDRTARWVDLPQDVALFMRPAGTAEVHAYRSRAIRLFNEMDAAYKTARDSGLPWDGSDLSDPASREGLIYALAVIEAARELVSDWRGVADETGAALPFTTALLPRLMNIPEMAEVFFGQVVAPSQALAAEGNASGASLHGSTAMAPDTAPAA